MKTDNKNVSSKATDEMFLLLTGLSNDVKKILENIARRKHTEFSQVLSEAIFDYIEKNKSYLATEREYHFLEAEENRWYEAFEGKYVRWQDKFSQIRIYLVEYLKEKDGNNFAIVEAVLPSKIDEINSVLNKSKYLVSKTGDVCFDKQNKEDPYAWFLNRLDAEMALMAELADMIGKTKLKRYVENRSEIAEFLNDMGIDETPEKFIEAGHTA